VLLVMLASVLVRAEESPAIQRVELPPERLAAEMERLRRSVMTELPREQFEDLVRRAARADAADKSPPRLVEAH
jgi:hypothetical protein